ncbi:FAD-dependent oxidoreductase [Variovorax sp. HJSM1_2]|uniref:FAD-dependent oxidoreductase n=1 Tax=Variovorax sp. HJSM1_2 TaxID=3366263 RepID=UPI003BC9B94E
MSNVSHIEPRTEVLIVGAGPTGLVLALWLTEQGIQVRVVDKAAGPGSTSRAMAVQARTLELYRQLDLSDAVVAAGHQNPAINLWIKGQKKAQLGFGTAGEHLTPYPFLLVYPQDQHEYLLTERLASMGVQVEHQTECTGFEDRGGHVVATLRSADGQEQRCEARFLAGCDGAKSPIRHQLGTGFDGGTYAQIFYVADVEVTGPAADGAAHIALDDADFVALLAYGQGAGQTTQARLIGAVRDEREDADSLGFDDVSHRAIDALGLQVQKLHWFSTYRVHHRVTRHYRVGRTFLLGDAAHVHSPAGGQGMNTGIGDAINLAWKLAAVLRQQAPDALLDSYEVERKAFALKLVETTDRLFSFVTSESHFANFVRTQIAPILAPLAYGVDAVREYMFRVLSQTLINYRHSPLSMGTQDEDQVHGGDRLPWVATHDGPEKGAEHGTDNYESLRDITWQVHIYGDPTEPVTEELLQACAACGVPLRRFDYTPAHQAAGLARDALYLLRPDTYVAMVEPTGDAQALARYFAERGIRLGSD